MKYKFVLLDLDDTLLDFSADERQAIEKTFAAVGIAATEQMKDFYSHVNSLLWKKLEKGQIDRAGLWRERFEILRGEYSIDCSADRLNSLYLSALSEGGRVVRGAREVCRRLSSMATLAIVTNGVGAVQEKRLRAGGLGKYFKYCFASEQIGAAKPDRAFFDYVFASIENFEPHRAIIVGDSLSSDIAGGQGAGIDTCLFKGSGKAAEGTQIVPTYQIEKLEEIIDIVKGENECHQSYNAPPS